MMKRKHTRLCASAAIAAALALSSTPLLAQVAETTTTVEPAPVLTIPETPAPEPVQPTIVLPSDIPESTPAPTMTTTSERATPTTRTERATSPAAPRTPARVPAASPAEPAPAATTTDVETATAVSPAAAVAEPVAPLAAAEPETIAEEPADNGNANAVLDGLAAIAAIAAIVLAIWGFVAIGRRKPADRRAAEVIERPVLAPSVPVASPVMPEPVIAEPVIAERAPVTPTPIHASAPSMAHSGAAVPLPRSMPATFEERNALIDRMVAAKPDRANPFSSPIQRRKRAKLILQSLGRDFGGREPWIDFSQYPQNWPELAGRNTAAA